MREHIGFPEGLWKCSNLPGKANIVVKEMIQSFKVILIVLSSFHT